MCVHKWVCSSLNFCRPPKKFQVLSHALADGGVKSPVTQKQRRVKCHSFLSPPQTQSFITFSR